ncbi:MAG: hypothetical protein O7E54_01795 [Planctomycetota bacterium]|nr:hypothetical protein [Planctomycetota bacterium]
MRFSPTALVLVLATASAAAALPAPRRAAPQSSWHVDERIGFKFRPLKGWDQIPLKVGENVLLAKYLSEKPYFYTDKIGGWTWEFHPELQVIAINDEDDEDADDEGEEEEEETEDEDEGADDEPKFKLKRATFKTYEDYLDKTYTGGGFFIDKRGNAKAGKVEVSTYEIKVEKLTRTGPKRILTWVYHVPGVDLAMQYEIPEDAYKKLRNRLSSSFRSFKVIPRTMQLPGGEDLLTGWITLYQMQSGTPAERKEKRLESVAQHRRNVLRTLPDDWTAKQMGRCFVLNHVDERYAKRVVAQCEGVMAWLDETFPFVGPEEYVRSPILRICDGRDEEWAFRRGGDGWYGTGIEIVTHKDRDGWNDWEQGWTNEQVLRHWFTERDRDLWYAMPSWFKEGLKEYAEGAYLKGRKLQFKPDGWDRDNLRALVREGKATRPRDLVRMTRAQFREKGSSLDHQREAAALVRFFLSGKAAKNRQSRDVVATYLRNLSAIVAESEDAKISKKPKDFDTEEEEEQWYKERSKALQSREEQLVEDAWFRTFRGWSDRDWNVFEKNYFNEID